jgi:hypothetical protein
MLNPSRKVKKKLIKAYKAFYDKAMLVTGVNLTLEEKRAVGQKVLDDIYEKAFNNLNTPENEREALKKELEEIIRKEYPDLLSDTSLEFTERGFRRKKL